MYLSSRNMTYEDIISCRDIFYRQMLFRALTYFVVSSFIISGISAKEDKKQLISLDASRLAVQKHFWFSTALCWLKAELASCPSADRDPY